MRAKAFLIFSLCFVALTHLERDAMRAAVFGLLPSLSKNAGSEQSLFSYSDRRISSRSKFLRLAKEDGPLSHDQITVERLDVPANKSKDGRDHYYLRLTVSGVSMEQVDLNAGPQPEPTLLIQDRQLRVYDEFGTDIEAKVDRDLRYLRLARMVDLAKTLEFKLQTSERNQHLDFLPHGKFPVPPTEFGNLGFEYRVGVVEEHQIKLPAQEFNTCNLGSPYLEVYGIDQGSAPFYSVSREPSSLRLISKTAEHPVRTYRISTSNSSECEELRSRVRSLASTLRKDMKTQNVAFPMETKMISVSTQVLAIQLDSLTGVPQVRIDNP